MEFNQFVRKPFIVEAVQVTEANMAELAPMIGDLRKKENGVPYIQVDRKKVPNIYRVYIGFWVTKMGENVRCYAERIFQAQFIKNKEEVENWVRYLNDDPDEEFSVLASPGNHNEDWLGRDVNVKEDTHD